MCCLSEISENTACSDNPCQNNGTCTSLSSTEYTCSCTKGYAGKNCEEGNKITNCSPHWYTEKGLSIL